MKNIQPYEYDPKAIINGAVGSDRIFCMGYLNPGATGTGYIATMKLSVGSVKVENLDEVTEKIVAYDRCEANDAYIGQINMLTASSFSGLNGAVWGYDLAVADNLRGYKFFDQPDPRGGSIPVYSVYPLLDATQRLFGSNEQRRFNPMPGAHVVCANKDKTIVGAKNTGTWVWSAIAHCILDDRSTGANLFIEDANTCPGEWDYNKVYNYLIDTLHKIAYSVVLCGVDQDVRYKEIFTGFKFMYIPDGYVGCALTCAPYITLAQNAIPGGDIRYAYKIIDMTVGEWEAAVHLGALDKMPIKNYGFLSPNGIDKNYGIGK